MKYALEKHDIRKIIFITYTVFEARENKFIRKKSLIQRQASSCVSLMLSSEGSNRLSLKRGDGI